MATKVATITRTHRQRVHPDDLNVIKIAYEFGKLLSSIIISGHYDIFCQDFYAFLAQLLVF